MSRNSHVPPPPKAKSGIDDFFSKREHYFPRVEEIYFSPCPESHKAWVVTNHGDKAAEVTTQRTDPKNPKGVKLFTPVGAYSTTVIECSGKEWGSPEHNLLGAETDRSLWKSVDPTRYSTFAVHGIVIALENTRKRLKAAELALEVFERKKSLSQGEENKARENSPR